jgi:di/tricarboxylate transporter
MTTDQMLAFAILGATLIGFVWGRWRYDVVAVFALLAVVLTGLVAPEKAFDGFAHPAVITVAAVLVISRGLQNAGIVDVVAKLIAPLRGRENLQIAAQCSAAAALSSFMNNVGALALMLPVALRNAYRDNYPPAKSLMPLAFASLLGGMTTLIGTPPNIIVSSFRAQQGDGGFAMFDFTPVGVAVAAAGLIFLATLGWRCLPFENRKSGEDSAFKIEGYVAEADVPEKAKAVGLTIADIERLANDDITIVGLIRDKRWRLVPAGHARIQAGDILVLRGDTGGLKTAIDEAGLKLAADREIHRDDLKSDEIDVIEAVVNPDSRIIARTPISMRLRTVYGVNLLAIARQGHRVAERLSDVRFQSGDVLLLQGPAERMPEILSELGLLPLAERSIGIGRPRRLLLAGGVFGAAIVATVAGHLPVHVAFTAAAALMVATNVVKPGELYNSIDWPVIVLLAAMFPVGAALETTGGAALVADGILHATDGLNVIWVLLILLVGTMFLSDVINNNATAVIMAPIALTLASRLGVNADAFLMAVAIGASSAFLTPIGHQSNTLVMEPGGYRFGDYWRMGLPLEIVIVAVGLPMLLLVWPL